MKAPTSIMQTGRLGLRSYKWRAFTISSPLMPQADAGDSGLPNGYGCQRRRHQLRSGTGDVVGDTGALYLRMATPNVRVNLRLILAPLAAGIRLLVVIWSCEGIRSP